MKFIRTTRQEMERLSAELRVKEALKAKLLSATRYDFSVRKYFREYSEKSRTWEGLFKITKIMGKKIWITDGKIQPFSRTQILPDPADVADKELSRLLEGFKNFNSGGIPAIYVTEEIHPTSPRNHDPAFDITKFKEMCGLIEKGTFKVICSPNVEQDAKILGERLVLATNNIGTNNLVYKDRFVVQMHLDKEKEMLVHNASTIIQH